MVSQEATLIQNKIVGVALRDARLRAKKSPQQCAEALSCSPEAITRAEEGLAGMSLPQLEALAHFLGTSLGRMLGEEDLSEGEPQEAPLPYDRVMAIRHKIIGLILRQARQELGRTLEDVAVAMSYTPEQLAHIEIGDEPVTLVELRALAENLGISFDSFIAEDVIPMSPAERDARNLRRLAHLPSEVREFIFKPINLPYLQIAMNLSRMPSEALRQIASGLLEITY